MPGQGLDDLLRLPVIKHVHDIAVPERVGRHRNRKVHPVSFSPFHGLLEPVPHGFICDGPQRFTPAGTGGDQSALHLPDIAYICQRDQTDLIFLFRQHPHKGSKAIEIKGLGCQGSCFPYTDPGVPHGRKQHVMPLIGHIKEEGTHFRGQKVGRGSPGGGGHAS